LIRGVVAGRAIVATVFVALALALGCAAPDPQREARERAAAEAAERASSRLYVRPIGAVWDAVLAAAVDRRLSVTRQSRESGELDLRAGAAGFSAGERIRVRITPERDGAVRVEIRSEPVLGFTLSTDWQRVLFGDLEQRLAPRRVP